MYIKGITAKKEELLPECVALMIGVEAVRSSIKDGSALPVEGGRIICIGVVVSCHCCGVLIVEDAPLSKLRELSVKKAS